MRAICTLRPGVEGLSESGSACARSSGASSSTAASTASRPATSETYLLGSADLMPRNLDHRIEVVVPVEAPHVRAEIETIFKALLADNSQAWLMSPDGSWERARPENGERRRASQLVAMRGRMRARRRTAPGRLIRRHVAWA